MRKANRPSQICRRTVCFVPSPTAKFFAVGLDFTVFLQNCDKFWKTISYNGIDEARGASVASVRRTTSSDAEENRQTAMRGKCGAARNASAPRDAIVCLRPAVSEKGAFAKDLLTHLYNFFLRYPSHNERGGYRFLKDL